MSDLRKALSELVCNEDEHRNPNGVVLSAMGFEATLSCNHGCEEPADVVTLTSPAYFIEELIAAFGLESMIDFNALTPAVLWERFRSGEGTVFAGVNEAPHGDLSFRISEGRTIVSEVFGDEEWMLDEVLGDGAVIEAYAKEISGVAG